MTTSERTRQRGALAPHWRMLEPPPRPGPSAPGRAGPGAVRLHLGRVPAPDPIGAIVFASDGTSLVALDFGPSDARLARGLATRFGADVALAEAPDPQGFGTALAAYLDGRIDALNDLPADGGGSPFQVRVWAALREIPPGETRTYGEIAGRIGEPGAARAVGLANGSNPIALVVPCHRVIGSGGALIGYGGGLDRKRWLLAHERRTRDPGLPLFA